MTHRYQGDAVKYLAHLSQAMNSAALAEGESK